MDLKQALFISFLSHCFVLTPLGALGFFSSKHKEPEMQITYYQLKPLEVKVAKTTIAPAPVKKDTADAAKPEAAKPKPQISEAKAVREKIARKIKITKAKPQEKTPPLKNNFVPASIPGTTLPNTPECLDYYHYIREQIRYSLEKEYSHTYKEGEVIISFVLNQKGELMSLKVLEAKSSDDAGLHRISYESVKDASPFKPFPKGLELNQISFTLTILFKKK